MNKKLIIKLYNQAVDHYKDERLEQAETILRKILEGDNYIYPLFLLGQVCLKKAIKAMEENDLDEIVEFLEEAFKNFQTISRNKKELELYHYELPNLKITIKEDFQNFLKKGLKINSDYWPTHRTFIETVGLVKIATDYLEKNQLANALLLFKSAQKLIDPYNLDQLKKILE